MYRILPMTRFTGLIIICFSIAFSSCKKKEETQSRTVTDFKKHYTITSSYDPSSSVFTVKVTMDPLLHAYAEGETIGRPVRLLISPKNGWAAEGKPKLPQGTKKRLSGLGESVIVEGNIEIKQMVKKGQGPGQATLYLQVCTDNACDQPRAHILTI